ncbi:MAG: acetate kinase, partial [Aquihabitans sp.]
MSTVLVINAGSSSLKYELVDVDAGRSPASGQVERIGDHDGQVTHEIDGHTTTRCVPVADHREAMTLVIDLFAELGPSLVDAGIVAVGHRVVMGGTEIDGPVVVDDELLATIERLSPLAPLHNPANLEAIGVARNRFPDLPHVAVFDTAFFHGLPPAAITYAIDRDIAKKYGIRRYGFHGTSHEYVSATGAHFLGQAMDPSLRQVVLHLGNGASASAVVGGQPLDTSMGMTPLEGLVMGTRTGDIDPAVILHLSRNAGMSTDEIDELFNHRSGMVGLTGEKDMREVHRLIAEGDAQACLALDVYVHRLRKYVGAYAAVMGGIDVLTFTAGVGENDAVVRSEVAAGLAFLGITVDPDLNTAPSRETRAISPEGFPVAVLVVPTDEEL